MAKRCRRRAKNGRFLKGKGIGKTLKKFGRRKYVKRLTRPMKHALHDVVKKGSAIAAEKAIAGLASM